jgi:hypothetical protein
VQEIAGPDCGLRSITSREGKSVKRLASIAVAAATAALGVVGFAAPAHADSTYTLRNLQYNQCMDLANGNPANGTPIGRTPYCGDGAANRLWLFEDIGFRQVCNFEDLLGNCVSYKSVYTYRIKSVATGKCVDINAGGTSSGETIHEWDCLGVISQLWYLIGTGAPNTNLIVSAHAFNETQNERVIDSGPTYLLRIWTRNNTPAQLWVFQ